MTQTNTWAATIAPIGEASRNNKIIDPACVITVSDGAPLLTRTGTRIGEVTSATIIEGHIVVTGSLDHGNTIPNALPTFYGEPSDRRTYGDGPYCGTTTFHALTITAVYAGFEPEWSDPEIMFTSDWCVHVLGPDDLIPMPDYATADRAATRFNRWWQSHRARRLNDDGIDLPETPAVVRPWPYVEEYPNGHAEALADLRSDDPDGWLCA